MICVQVEHNLEIVSKQASKFFSIPFWWPFHWPTNEPTNEVSDRLQHSTGPNRSTDPLFIVMVLNSIWFIKFTIIGSSALSWDRSFAHDNNIYNDDGLSTGVMLVEIKTTKNYVGIQFAQSVVDNEVKQWSRKENKVEWA